NRRVQDARREADGVHHQYIAVPSADGVAGASRLEVRRMLLHVRIDGPLEAHLSVLKKDGVLVLRDPVDWSVERPVEDDAGRLAAEARIVLLREGCGRLLSELGQLGAAVEPRPGCRASASASTPGAGGTFARLEVIQ